MQITVSKIDRGVILYIDGRLDVVTSPGLRDKIMELIEGGQISLVIDCALLSYIGSAGLRVFYQALAKVEEKGGKLALCRPREEVHRVFDMVDMASEIPIFSDKEEAIKSLA